jgi:hypothetical protein
MDIHALNAVSALVGSIIGGIAVLVGALIGSKIQTKRSREQDARKYIIEEALDRFICKINFELFAVISLLKARSEIKIDQPMPKSDSDILSPVISFADVYIHRLNELHPILFQQSINVIETLTEIKAAANEIMTSKNPSSNTRFHELLERINKNKTFIERVMLIMGQISTILYNKGFVLNNLHNILTDKGFLKKIEELKNLRLEIKK